MIKIGQWWAPDNTIIVNDLILKEEFTCIQPLEKAFKYVKNFNTAIDIGTWIGDSTTHMARKFSSIIGFEANKDVYECCLRNLTDRNLTNCNIKNIGISNTSGKKNFFNGKCNFSGWVSEKTEYDIAISNNFIVDTITLDELDITDVDFLKIDVDSHEGFLLDGARKFLTIHSPVILIENKTRIHKERQTLDMPDPAEILESLGYEMVEKAAKADFIYVKR